ncbi:MAG: hypothetical protein NWE89_03020 [Candidatus Bathyarchaeota archaeon]|nr:hypothetical protein [Candidatus Bathyarchaeota archaeon]
MNLRLITSTSDIETMIATSMLTTTSGALPSRLYERLKVNPDKVKDILGRVEVQHGNILEHNRLIWELEATDPEVMEIILDTRFLTFTRLNEGRWLVSGDLRTVAEYAQSKSSEFTEALTRSIKDVAPNIAGFLGRKTS